MNDILKLTKGGDHFIFEIKGLSENELLNLVKQSMDLGYKVDATTEEERQSVLEMPYLAQHRMEKLFQEWDGLIDWEKLTEN